MKEHAVCREGVIICRSIQQLKSRTNCARMETEGGEIFKVQSQLNLMPDLRFKLNLIFRPYSFMTHNDWFLMLQVQTKWMQQTLALQFTGRVTFVEARNVNFAVTQIEPH